MYLSNHTVRCRINFMSHDVLDHVADEILGNRAESPFS